MSMCLRSPPITWASILRKHRQVLGSSVRITSNYGSARFSLDGQDLLVITGTGLIETIHLRSGVVRLKICCSSSIYGEPVFTPDGQEIAHAGHWPRLWDASSGRLIGELTARSRSLNASSNFFRRQRDAILMGS